MPPPRKPRSLLTIAPDDAVRVKLTAGWAPGIVTQLDAAGRCCCVAVRDTSGRIYEVLAVPVTPAHLRRGWGRAAKE